MSDPEIIGQAPLPTETISVLEQEITNVFLEGCAFPRYNHLVNGVVTHLRGRVAAVENFTEQIRQELSDPQELGGKAVSALVIGLGTPIFWIADRVSADRTQLDRPHPRRGNLRRAVR